MDSFRCLTELSGDQHRYTEDTLGTQHEIRLSLWRTVLERQALVLYSALFAVWFFLWRLPILQGDDRFFAVASGKPWGYQDLPTVIEYVWKTWALYNGRIADGLGVLWYLFGDSVARIIFAASYVLLVFLLEQWLRVFATIPQDKENWVRLILVTAPLLLSATNIGVAGQSVFLAAAVWNYIMPLNLLFIALYPLMRRVAGQPVRPMWEILSLPVVFFALQMHEMLMIGVVGGGLTLLVYKRSLIKDPWFLITTAVIACGAIAKLAAPGLWARADNNDIGTAVEGLSSLETKIIQAASAFSDYPVFYPLLGFILITSILLAGRMYPEFTSVGMNWQTLVTFVSVGMWALLSGYHRLLTQWLSASEAYIPDALSSKLLAFLVLFALMSFAGIGLWLAQLSRTTQDPLPLFFYGAAVLTLLATAAMAPHLWAPLKRTHYVTLVMLALAGVLLLARLLTDHEKKSPTPALWGLVSVVLVLSGFALLNVSSQMIQNHLAWNEVEAQIEEVKQGERDTVSFPDALPCRDLTWYFWPDDRERSYEQFAVYYDIPAQTAFETVHENRECLSIP